MISGYTIKRDQTTQALRAEVQSGARAEFKLHAAIVDLLSATRLPGVVFWHTPNGARRKPAEAAALKAMGLLAGVADLCISIPGAKFCFMEVKASHGRLSDEQEAFLAGMERNGHRTAVVRDLGEAMAFLRDWGAIRAVRVAA